MITKTKHWGTGVRTTYDGVLKQEFATQAHEPGKFVINTTQPNKNIILERNKQIRDNKLEKDLSFGRHVACVPIEDLIVLRKKHPMLNSKNAQERTSAWAKVLKSPEYKKYLTVNKY